MSQSSLLSKAIVLKKNSGSDVQSDPISLLKQITSGLNAPFEVFEILCKEMKFSHAALLMLDPETKEYFPVIKKNFDRTSAVRLKIPVKALAKLISKESKIQRYLSYNDCKTIKEIHFTDLGNNKTKIVLLYSLLEQNIRTQATSTFITDNLDLIRSKLLSFDKPAKQNKTQHLSPLFLIKANQFIKNKLSRNKSFYLFHIDAEESIKRIVAVEGLKEVNSYQIENKVYDIFENNVDHFGVITQIRFGHFLMLLQLPKMVSPQLITEHFNYSLHQNFNIQRKWKDLIIQHRKYFETLTTVGKAALLLLNQN